MVFQSTRNPIGFSQCMNDSTPLSSAFMRAATIIIAAEWIFPFFSSSLVSCVHSLVYLFHCAFSLFMYLFYINIELVWCEFRIYGLMRINAINGCRRTSDSDCIVVAQRHRMIKVYKQTLKMCTTSAIHHFLLVLRTETTNIERKKITIETLEIISIQKSNMNVFFFWISQVENMLFLKIRHFFLSQVRRSDNARGI